LAPVRPIWKPRNPFSDDFAGEIQARLGFSGAIQGYSNQENGFLIAPAAQTTENVRTRKRWKDIYETNKDQIKDPNLIHPGQELRIP